MFIVPKFIYLFILFLFFCSQKENEEENAKIAWMKQKELRLAFDEQMRWKQKKELEEQRAKDLERLRTEEQIELNKQFEKKG